MFVEPKNNSYRETLGFMTFGHYGNEFYVVYNVGIYRG